MLQWTPSQRELDDLELVLLGAAAPETLSIDLPAELAGRVDADSGGDGGDGAVVELLDPEGLALARLTPATGHVQPLSQPAFGPFRRYVVPASHVRAEHPEAFVVPVTAPLTGEALSVVRQHATATGCTPVLLVCTGVGSPEDMSAPGLVRATLAAAAYTPGAVVVAAPVTGGRGSERLRQAAAAYADATLDPPGGGELPPQVRAVVDQDRPPRHRRGVVVFFTGLSGSGKSTISRALVDRLLERGDRTVTSLDGDVVRHHLSKGLGFGRQDRETNIARIGWVAAEISRHHGVAVCSPIAPFDDTRRQVRAMAADAGGGFVLVHVATPLAECERRDRKGLYARARAGEIPDFTGLSSPYEEPTDATLRIDTTGRDIDECVDEVLGVLTREGWLL